MHTLVRRPSSVAIPAHLSLLFALSLSLCCGIGRSADFCAVRVHVVDSKGIPVTRSWIELENSRGVAVRREIVVGPDFDVCDFGFGPHTLRIGTNECLPVAISNLKVVFGHPVSLVAVINGCSYRNMRSACLAYFRVSDASGAPVGGAVLSRQGAPDVQTDSFGRWQGLFDGSRDVTFTKTGFEPVIVHVGCASDEEVDRPVVMSRPPDSSLLSASTDDVSLGVEETIIDGGMTYSGCAGNTTKGDGSSWKASTSRTMRRVAV